MTHVGEASIPASAQQPPVENPAPRVVNVLSGWVLQVGYSVSCIGRSSGASQREEPTIAVAWNAPNAMRTLTVSARPLCVLACTCSEPRELLGAVRVDLTHRGAVEVRHCMVGGGVWGSEASTTTRSRVRHSTVGGRSLGNL